MIKARFGTTPETITQINDYFDLNVEPHWITHPMVKDIIKDIDGSEVIAGGLISCPIWGYIPPKDISGGSKLLILLLFDPENEYYGTKSGNNCAPWIYKISKIHDIKLAYTNVMEFPDEITDLNMILENDGRVINTMQQFLEASFDFI